MSGNVVSINAVSLSDVFPLKGAIFFFAINSRFDNTSAGEFSSRNSPLTC